MSEWKVLKGEHVCALWNDEIYHVHEPIVRCRDCRHFKPGEEEPPVDWCDWFHDEVTPLGFCAWGERRDA